MMLAVLQARMSSTRMPGKVMAPILGEPMIWRQIERLRRARTLSKIVVATSTATSDDALAGFLLGRGCSVFRGELADVLGRFATCAALWSPTHVIRLTADCPLVDPQVIDAAATLATTSGAAYTSNCEQRSYPDGLDVEVLTAEALATAAREAADAYDREHVTPFVRARPERFAQVHLRRATDLSELRWTVDRPADFAFVRTVYQQLHPQDPAFGMDEVLDLLAARPDLAALASKAQAEASTGSAGADLAQADSAAA